jgi:hypothetical protein
MKLVIILITIASKITIFEIKKNGNYIFKFFESSKYIPLGKNLELIINEKDSLQLIQNEKSSIISLTISSWDPYLTSSWIGFYIDEDESPSKLKKYKNFEYYCYVKNKNNLNLKDFGLKKGNYEARVFQYKESKEPRLLPLKFELI